MATWVVPVSWWVRCGNRQYKKQEMIPALPHIGMTAALFVRDSPAETFRIKDAMWDEATGFFWIELDDADAETFSDRFEQDPHWELA
jgi:hypothetical protein